MMFFLLTFTGPVVGKRCSNHCGGKTFGNQVFELKVACVEVGALMFFTCRHSFLTRHSLTCLPWYSPYLPGAQFTHLVFTVYIWWSHTLITWRFYRTYLAPAYLFNRCLFYLPFYTLCFHDVHFAYLIHFAYLALSYPIYLVLNFLTCCSLT